MSEETREVTIDGKDARAATDFLRARGLSYEEAYTVLMVSAAALLAGHADDRVDGRAKFVADAAAVFDTVMAALARGSGAQA